MNSQKYGKLKLLFSGAAKEVSTREHLTGKLMTDLQELLINRPGNDKKEKLLDLLNSKSDDGNVTTSVQVLKALMTGQAFADKDTQVAMNAIKYEFVRNCIEQSDLNKHKELQMQVYNIESKQVNEEAYLFWQEQFAGVITEVFEFFRQYIIRNTQ